ncbi:MAG TPA: YIP1 family protein, partial [Chloroflexota bacterium]|nr:YIP1 family protein [Chloroflexota bacterium]
SIQVGFGSILVWAVVSWLLWAGAIYVIGVKGFKGDATMSQIMRVLGFAYAPAAFNIFSFTPLMGIIIQFLVACWLVVSFYFATQNVLGLSEGSKAFVTVLAGWFIYLIGLGVVMNFLGALAGL